MNSLELLSDTVESESLAPLPEIEERGNGSLAANGGIRASSNIQEGSTVVVNGDENQSEKSEEEITTSRRKIEPDNQLKRVESMDSSSGKSTEQNRGKIPTKVFSSDMSETKPGRGNYLDAVREALVQLGGRAFGNAILEYICEHRSDMLDAFSNDKKKLRYCINGLLSARVNSSVFEKKIYKENGTHRTEWMLADSNLSFDDVVRPAVIRSDEPPVIKEKKVPITTSSSQVESDSSDEGTEDENPSGNDSPNSTPKIHSQRLKNKRLALSSKGSDKGIRSKGSPQLSDERSSMSLRTRATSSRDKKRTPVRDLYERDSFKDELLETSGIELDESLLEEEPSLPRRIIASNSTLSLDTLAMNGDIPQTYRGMIKITLESMGGEANFEAISKYIGTRFKEQLNSKAETWKHSIAGCLSVYFARKEEKDPSGKVIWTLGAPPKPKRRGRRRDRNPNDMDLDRDIDEEDRLSPSPERTVSRGKRKKEETVSIPLEQLEALEEENECLKLLVAKKKRMAKEENTQGEACSVCKERRELCLVLNPCGHLFCGSIFCDASSSKSCMICRVDVAGRLPVRLNKEKAKPSSTVAHPLIKKDSNGNLNGLANLNGNANGKPHIDFGNGLLQSLSSIVNEERIIPNG